MVTLTETMSSTERKKRALERIKAAHPEGRLVREDIVENAQHPDSDLHGDFNWDDSKAAHQWRLVQAGQLVRSIFVVWPSEDGTKKKVNKYVSVINDRQLPGGGYRETSEVIASKELLAQLEETAKKDLDGVLSRYEMLTDLVANVRKAAGIESKKKKKR